MIKRYSRKELTDIWSEENKYKIWLDVEIAAAQAMEKLGQIPMGVSSVVRKKTRINVKREIILIETSKIGSNQKPPINEIGMPNETQPASLGLRNRASTKSTSVKPRIAFSTNKSILPLRITDSSFIELNEIPGGIVGLFFFR